MLQNAITKNETFFFLSSGSTLSPSSQEAPMLPFASVNLITVLIATIVHMMLNILWFSPLLYGKIWIELVHLTAEECREGMRAKILLGSLATTFVSIYVIALVLEVMAPATFMAAMVIGGLLLIALPLPMELNGLLWEKRPVRLMWINFGNTLFTTLISVSILFYYS